MHVQKRSFWILFLFFLHLWNIMYFIWTFGTDSFNFIHKIPREIITKWFYWCEIWQGRRWWLSMQNVNYWIQRWRGLSELSVITSVKYFDLALVIILLHRWHWCLQRERSRCVHDLRHVGSWLWRRVIAFIIYLFIKIRQIYSIHYFVQW